MISYTINTDASYSRRYRIATWAYWIKGDGNFSAKKSGAFDRTLHSSFMAELLTFEKAFQEINKIIPYEHRGATLLFINTDSTYVIDVINGKAKPKSTRNKPIVQAIQHAIKGYKLVPRHVKAHTGDLRESRVWVNDWCDRAAKVEMGKELEKLKGVQDAKKN